MQGIRFGLWLVESGYSQPMFRQASCRRYGFRRQSSNRREMQGCEYEPEKEKKVSGSMLLIGISFDAPRLGAAFGMRDLLGVEIAQRVEGVDEGPLQERMHLRKY